jgi:hypothetical protein
LTVTLPEGPPRRVTRSSSSKLNNSGSIQKGNQVVQLSGRNVKKLKTMHDEKDGKATPPTKNSQPHQQIVIAASMGEYLSHYQQQQEILDTKVNASAAAAAVIVESTIDVVSSSDSGSPVVLLPRPEWFRMTYSIMIHDLFESSNAKLDVSSLASDMCATAVGPNHPPRPKPKYAFDIMPCRHNAISYDRKQNMWRHNAISYDRKQNMWRKHLHVDPSIQDTCGIDKVLLTSYQDMRKFRLESSTPGHFDTEMRFGQDRETLYCIARYEIMQHWLRCKS